jgi:TonB-dependent receptor
MYRAFNSRNVRTNLLCASALAGLALTISPTSSQAADPSSATAANNGTENELVVTGFRGSLVQSTAEKRKDTNFTDTVFAEDIGKFPDLNLSEALNRIPGVQLTREITGEGVQVSVRGLGPSFTKVLLNGAQIAVASDGTTDAGNSNREVDLDMFPSELFTRLDVIKTPVAHLLEGGVAGTVDMNNARPFDNPGQHITVIAQGGYGNSSGKFSPRGAVIASKTWDTFGVLLGFAGARTESRVDGFESIGWTDPNISCTGCNTTGTGNGFTFASVAPPNVGNGFTPGQAIDVSKTSGLSLVDLSNALIPRLGRNSFNSGTRDRINGLFSFQARPNDRFSFTFDAIGGKAYRTFDRFDMDWFVRNSAPNSTGGMIPINVTIDSNGVVTGGTFANSRFFLEARPYKENVDFYSLTPAWVYHPTDWSEVDLHMNYSKSTFYRTAPSFLWDTPFESGITVNYANNGGPIPTIKPSADLSDPNLGWTWDRVNIQNVSRRTDTKGAHLDVILGHDTQIRFGGAYDDIGRAITAFDNSAAYQANAFAALPNGSFAQYFSRGPASDFMHLVGGDPGYTKFIVPNLPAIEKATNFDFYNDNAPYARSSATATPSGTIREKTLGAYIELNGQSDLLDRMLSYNMGVRYVHTDQHIRGPVLVNNVLSFVTLDTSYDDWLPSFNAAYDLTNKLKLRFAASRTLTRANPNALLPGTTFSDPSAQSANQGNPQLSPYTSNNFDIGGEYYTGGAGYFGVALFNKDISGFTVNQTITRPYSFLGIPFDALSPIQQAAINSRGGPDVATVQVNSQVNISQKLTMRGAELDWVQPLDMLYKGLGLTANFTHLIQDAHGSTAVATGISPNSFNVTGYYENHSVSVHVTYEYADGKDIAAAPQNGVNVPLRVDSRGQWDLSASYLLPWFGEKFQLTFDAINFTNSPLRQTFGFHNATYTYYNPGSEYLLGIRASF